MLSGLLLAENAFIAICYFTIAILILLPFLQGQQKTPLVVATILVFFSCALGHSGHVLLMATPEQMNSSVLLKLQVGVDLFTALVASTYIAMRRYYSFLVNGPFLLTQAQDQLTEVNSELAKVMASVELVMAEQVAEVAKTNEQLKTELIDRHQVEAVLRKREAMYQPCFHNHPNLNHETVDRLPTIDVDFLQTELPDLLKSIKVGTDRIQQIVLALQNVSQFYEAEMDLIDVHDCIDSAVLMLQSQLQLPNQVEIEIVKKYDELPLVECCPTQLKQVFMNVLMNAVDALEDDYRQLKFTDRSQQSTARIKIHTQMMNSNWVSIHIADNGPGISEDAQQQLFNPFFTTKPIDKGIGLGLSICYQIVQEKHGGDLFCLSEPGQGAEFVIEIPVRQLQQWKV